MQIEPGSSFLRFPPARCATAFPSRQAALWPSRSRPRQFYPQGYPESLIRRLRYFFYAVTPEDIYKWNVTSPEIVKYLLKISEGRRMDAQVTTCLGDADGVRLCRPRGGDAV